MRALSASIATSLLLLQATERCHRKTTAPRTGSVGNGLQTPASEQGHHSGRGSAVPVVPGVLTYLG